MTRKEKVFVAKVTLVGSFVVAIIGLIIFFCVNSKNEKTGYYTAQDTLDSYNLGYKVGAQNMRHIITKEQTDTTRKSCQSK